jgi:hypothetical protein
MRHGRTFFALLGVEGDGSYMKPIDLYLDLDGVILRRTGRTESRGRTEFEVAPGGMDFLSWAIENFNCYWLTSRSHDGTYDEIERAFRFAIPAANISNDVRQLIRAICPAPWGGGKVKGIDLSKDFYWVDDNPDDVSVDAMKNAGLKSRLILASTDQHPNDLERVRRQLGNLASVSSGLAPDAHGRMVLGNLRR